MLAVQFALKKPGVPSRLSIQQFRITCRDLAQKDVYCCAAGNLNTNGQELLVYGRHFGNIFIGVQVSMLPDVALRRRRRRWLSPRQSQC
jgi:hypothetical protein